MLVPIKSQKTSLSDEIASNESRCEEKIMTGFRIEKDSMGEVKVPATAYYGAQTQRAVENFPISGQPLPKSLIHALGLIKAAAASANRDLGKLNAELAEPIIAAAREVAAGKLDHEFPIDVYQTGSGTSSNMNANEVIANRAIELTGGDRFAAKKAIHANDHVNMGQSTNDMFPTAIHVAVGQAISKELVPVLERLRDVFADKAKQWNHIVKIGRTHLADATPLRLGQEIGGFARQLELSRERALHGLHAVLELPAGGTAVGTGINTHHKFGAKVAEHLTKETGIKFVEARNHFEANANRDGLVECSGELRAIAVSLFSIANNIRWLASGPRCGFYEIMLPDRQPGSSIMPGKVNPVMCESMMQVCARVIGNDQTIGFAGATGGQFQLNIMMPVMGFVVLESVQLLASCTKAFIEFCALEMEANQAASEAQVEKSLSMVTSLNPLIGYDAAAAIAKEAFKTGKTIRALCREKMLAGTLKKKNSDVAVSEAELNAALDPRGMTEPEA
jgi:fumarate hydratase class II